MKERYEHEMVPVEWNGFMEMIDKGIAPLILELWKAGIITVNSCEENRPGWVWIEFAHVTAAEAFLDIVAHYQEETDSLYNRIRGEWEPLEGELLGKWEYAALPFDMAVEATERDGEIEESCDGPSHFAFSLSVRFPRNDLPTVLARMRAYNRIKKSIVDNDPMALLSAAPS